jgi:hypothetical protein
MDSNKPCRGSRKVFMIKEESLFVRVQLYYIIFGNKIEIDITND